MEYSRVVKFKDYRDSFTKENSVKIDSKKTDDYMSSTTTLPYEEVIKEIGSEQELEKAEKAKKMKLIAMISFFAVVVLALIIGLVFLGIIAFGGKK